jgi:hypothetical protein
MLFFAHERMPPMAVDQTTHRFSHEAMASVFEVAILGHEHHGRAEDERERRGEARQRFAQACAASFCSSICSR